MGTDLSHGMVTSLHKQLRLPFPAAPIPLSSPAPSHVLSSILPTTITTTATALSEEHDTHQLRHEQELEASLAASTRIQQKQRHREEAEMGGVCYLDDGYRGVLLQLIDHGGDGGNALEQQQQQGQQQEQQEQKQEQKQEQQQQQQQQQQPQERLALASNDAFDNLFQSPAEIVQHCLEQSVLDVLLLAALFGPEDRHLWFEGIIHALFLQEEEEEGEEEEEEQEEKDGVVREEAVPWHAAAMEASGGQEHPQHMRAHTRRHTHTHTEQHHSASSTVVPLASSTSRDKARQSYSNVVKAMNRQGEISLYLLKTRPFGERDLSGKRRGRRRQDHGGKKEEEQLQMDDDDKKDKKGKEEECVSRILPSSFPSSSSSSFSLLPGMLIQVEPVPMSKYLTDRPELTSNRGRSRKPSSSSSSSVTTPWDPSSAPSDTSSSSSQTMLLKGMFRT
jgi:hypothetical protein